MRTTMFTRILLATLIPVFLVFSTVIVTIHNITYFNEAAYAKEYVKLTAKQMSDLAATKLENATVLQEKTSNRLSAIDFNMPGAEHIAEELLYSLIESDPDLYCVWFAFEPGVFPASGSSHYFATMMRTGNGIQTVLDLDDDTLDNPELSPWYNTPLATGKVYVNILDYYDYGTGEGLIHTFTMTSPIKSGDKTVGCVGLDIRYGNLFQMDDLSVENSQKLMLISSEGTILFSPDDDDVGKSLWDFDPEDMRGLADSLQDDGFWQGRLRDPFIDKTSIVVIYPLEPRHAGQPVYLYRSAPMETLYGIFYPSTGVIALTAVLGIILLAFCVFFTTKGVVRHIKRITDSFHKVASGGAEFTLGGEHIPITQTNIIELEILQSALVSMIIQLRKAHELKLGAVEAEIEKEKLIASAEAKTNFFAAISHEIRTPMNAILGISEIMLQEGDLSESQEKYIRDIKISSDSLLDVINDVLDISKMETGRMNLHPEHYNFKALIDNISSLATHMTADAGLKFKLETAGKLPLCLYGDGTRVRQVLLNLIGNSVKFTKEGFILMRIRAQEQTLRFDVVDTGIGIKESDIGSIFESFTRIDTRRNREVKGTGLGLTISKNLVELMGGTISAESVIGSGSTFSVTIPLVLGDENKLLEVTSSANVRYSDSLRILIVDDNEINLNVSAGLLKAVHGIRCDTAISGWEAISMVQKTDYDIIFMDHMMPELDGVDTTKRIRQLGPKYLDIPIIALTANAMMDARKELISAGMDDFMAKPIQSSRLREVLFTWAPESKRLPGIDGVLSSSGAPKPGFLSDPNVKSIMEAEGVDTIAGLENIGFDEDMYLQSLRLFREQLPENIKALIELLRQKNMGEFRIQIHKLKGSLASIGATKLSGYSGRLERAAVENNADYCDTYLPQLVTGLEQFSRKLCAILPSAATPLISVEDGFEDKRIEADDNAREQGLQRLCTALDEFDYEAVTRERIVSLSMGHGPEKADIVSKVNLFIESFDYTAAAELIRSELMTDRPVTLELIVSDPYKILEDFVDNT